MLAIRSPLRIVDQLPVSHASGLVSMVRTGPRRRQCIGDVVAGTIVVAVDGHAARRGTPSWYLPAATVCAVLLAAVSILAPMTASSRPSAQAQALLQPLSR